MTLLLISFVAGIVTAFAPCVLPLLPVMEHPAKILTDIRSEQELVQTASLFFEEFPTYTKILSGTPKLTRVFKVSEEYKVNEDLLVTLRRIELRFQA